MTVESSGGIDSGTLALFAKNQDGFGGMNGLLGIAALRFLMPGYGYGDMNGTRPLQASDVQNIVNDAIASSTANSNAMLLLKDIQDSSQGTDALIASTSSNLNQNILQGQIASLQGQSHIINEIHEVGDSVTNAVTTVNRDVLISRYEVEKSITNDGDKTRNMIAHLQASLPNAREVDLQRQLGVAQDAALEERLNRRIEGGNVSVTQTVNQNQMQGQIQAQMQGLISVIERLAAHQNAMATNLNILGTQKGINQTPVNVQQ